MPTQDNSPAQAIYGQAQAYPGANPDMSKWSPQDMYDNLYIIDSESKPEHHEFNKSINEKTGEPYLYTRAREGGPVGIMKDQLDKYKDELKKLPPNIQRLDTKDGNVILKADAPTS
jgi:hypothetical protein